MKFLFYLGHPAHFHLFHNTIKYLHQSGNTVSVLIKKKDVLEDLIRESGFQYLNILPEGRRESKVAISLGVLKRDWRLLRFCLKNRPDLMIGTSTEIGHIGTLLHIPSINVNEDDASVVPLYCKISYPWNTVILSPMVCDNGKWEHKSVKYQGYHELAYLHPNHFVPSTTIVSRYIDPLKPYFILRFAKLNAHHDQGIRGINDELALRIIEKLKTAGDVYITSERALDDQFEPYRLRVKPSDMHHIMAFAQIYIGDSQTMAAEAGVLGVPFIRFNDFVGRIGYLRELEEKYQLGYGVVPDNPDLLFENLEEILTMKDRYIIFQERRERMLADKIDYSKFLAWFIEHFPQSMTVMRSNPDYQFNF